MLRVDWGDDIGGLVGVLGLEALLQFVVLEAANSPTKAHFGVFVVMLSSGKSV